MALALKKQFSKMKDRDLQGTVAAIDRVMAVIEFALDGAVLTANPNFCSVMGYSAGQIEGRHHRMFVEPTYANSDSYAQFWRALGNGEFVAGEFKRLASDGREVWLQASYNPIKDAAGRTTRIVKFATDITAAKNKSIDAQGQLEAISRSQAVIEFNLDGSIITANGNFLRAVGYTLDEIRGRHHRMFVEPEFANSPDYKHFWEALGRGEFQAAEYKRLGKGGKPVWIQATYNPIRDPDGRPVKVVKYATDTTAAVQRRLQNEALAAQIERNLSGVTASLRTVTQQTGDIAGAVTETSTTIQSVAAAAEELTSSIAEISSSISSAKRSIDDASEIAGNADTSASALTQTAQQMSGIVELIDAIASQINLLALNATIESARAGEAGRGFAVVASEVKQLAAQVSNATKTISQEINGVQSVSADVVRALKAIQASISGMTENISSVASAVEQQSAATSEISSTMQGASSAAGSIDEGVTSIAGTMKDATYAIDQVQSSMSALVA